MTDRRAFLTAALFAPAMLVAPAAIAQTFACTMSPFDAALAEYRHARAEFDRIMWEDDADACTVAGNVSDEAFERMLLAPASTAADIATKLELLAFECEDCEFDQKRVSMIAKDARRLAS